MNLRLYIDQFIHFRKSLDPDRVKNMVICHDYWKRKEPDHLYELCPDCPRPPSKNATYVKCCSKHSTRFF